MKPIKLTGWIVIIILVIILFGGIFFPHQTKTTEVGVRVVKWSPFRKSGVLEKPYGAGATYFFPVIINEWYTFDTRLQNMEMTASSAGARAESDDLLFKTIDGNDISLDVIIAYRIDPEKAAEILIHVAESNRELEENLVRTMTRNITRDVFGELTSEDFYVAEKRTIKADEAKEILNNNLNKYGIIIESVLPKDYRFNEEYQNAIEQKKVADQVAERYKSEVNATVEEYLQLLEEAQGTVNGKVADADGEYEKAKIEADAYFRQQELIAEAIIAEGKNEAEGIQKQVQALNSAGGKTMVKLELAKALKGKSIYILPFGDGGGIDLKTTDINELLRVYGLKELQSTQ